MQAFFVTRPTDPYNPGVKTGRPSKYPRSPFGERLHAAREAAGLSQAQVAQKLGITQTAYAVWERHPVALRPEQIMQVAALLGVSPEQLFGPGEAQRRHGGPTGKARRIFERVSQLPRATQQRILANVEDAITAYEVRRTG